VRFCHGRNKWLCWTGTHWTDDQDATVHELAKLTAKSIFVEAASLPDDEARAMGRWAEHSLNREKIAAMLSLAESDSRLAITTKKLDIDPWLLNFVNGSVDLRTGKIREHRKDDLITKLIRFPYQPELCGPRWLRFVKQTFGELADWVQKAVGYSMTGVTNEKCVFILLGPTDTGKTTFLSTIKSICADYSTALQIDSLMWGRTQDNNTSADLADLRGARFVMTSETEEGQRLREAKLKRITQGMGDIKTARKYENPVTFPETHKLWIDANHAPMIRGTDEAIWKRLLPIPCVHKLAEQDKDTKLADKLLMEAEAIASWLVAGAIRWYEEGLGRPDVIVQQRSNWRATMDTLGDFLEERCVQDAQESATVSELYEAFHGWAEKHGHHPLTSTAFGLRLVDRGFEKSLDPSTRRVRYLGLRLRDAYE
jgi:putative DNA primase/helicase